MIPQHHLEALSSQHPYPQLKHQLLALSLNLTFLMVKTLTQDRSSFWGYGKTPPCGGRLHGLRKRGQPKLPAAFAPSNSLLSLWSGPSLVPSHVGLILVQGRFPESFPESVPPSFIPWQRQRMLRSFLLFFKRNYEERCQAKPGMRSGFCREVREACFKVLL